MQWSGVEYVSSPLNAGDRVTSAIHPIPYIYIDSLGT